MKLSELEQITARVGAFVGFLNDSLAGLQQRIDTVQQNWNGWLPTPKPTRSASGSLVPPR
ncbi:hypothetical protein [Nocardia implantans]|uniref:WXG100 family type VII secretion target n=1 Tax=Nocardia implantans TaxID=3108168 RepID=A0ABU6B4L8_9NOCA|nr:MULTISPECIES: hypothetical protein [unclassified Nocardia]MBF6193217.1 hypothetical protein [Nocardia beijingensis]MEA3531646.1 hypothetical protein [Nocardia sp. CDC192]MEB3514639.1 hypothetical protein [Nocardia sp. CDC186]